MRERINQEKNDKWKREKLKNGQEMGIKRGERGKSVYDSTRELERAKGR